MAERISRQDVAHVAWLARLRLSEAELDRFTAQLADVLDHAADVEALELTDVAPMSHPFGLVNVLRDDRAEPGLARDEVLEQAPDTQDGHFRVPPVLGEQS